MGTISIVASWMQNRIVFISFETVSFIHIFTLYGHIRTAEQRTIIHQYGGWYTGWAVTFGTARRGLGELRPRPVPSSLNQT